MSRAKRSLVPWQSLGRGECVEQRLSGTHIDTLVGEVVVDVPPRSVSACGGNDVNRVIIKPQHDVRELSRTWVRVSRHPNLILWHTEPSLGLPDDLTSIFSESTEGRLQILPFLLRLGGDIGFDLASKCVQDAHTSDSASETAAFHPSSVGSNRANGTGDALGLLLKCGSSVLVLIRSSTEVLR